MIIKFYKLAGLLVCFLTLMSGCNRGQSSSVATAEGWNQFTAPQGNFSVELPGVPTEKTDSTATVAGESAKHDFNLIVRENDKTVAAYLTSYADFRDGGIKAVGEQAFLEQTWQKSYAKMKGDLVYKRLTTYQGHTALEWQMRRMGKKGAMLTTARNVIDGDRLYMLSAITYEDEAQKANAKRYLDSLKILI